MKRFIKRSRSKFLLLVLVLLLATSSVYSRLIANEGDEMFGEEEMLSVISTIGSNPMGTGSSISMRGYIIRGAGQFLGAYSKTLQFLNKVEMSDLAGSDEIDYSQLQSLIDEAIRKLEGAKLAYAQLNRRAENTPYNPAKNERLIAFDYEGFRETKGLVGTIFTDVVFYLGTGDVRGVFARLLSDTEAILAFLYTAKATVEGGQLPLTSLLWQVNQAFSRTMLFGQYAAEVFYAVK